MTKEYVRANSKFVINIGSLLENKVNSMDYFNRKQWQIFNTNEDIALLLENSFNYKYKIKQNVWLQGINIEAFVQFVLNIKGK